MTTLYAVFVDEKLFFVSLFWDAAKQVEKDQYELGKKVTMSEYIVPDKHPIC